MFTCVVWCCMLLWILVAISRPKLSPPIINPRTHITWFDTQKLFANENRAGVAGERLAYRHEKATVLVYVYMQWTATTLNTNSRLVVYLAHAQTPRCFNYSDWPWLMMLDCWHWRSRDTLCHPCTVSRTFHCLIMSREGGVTVPNGCRVEKHRRDE